jgi:hypothetical protein
MSNVKVTAEGMAALLHVARGRNTVDRWCDIAIEWMRQADAALSAHDNNANVSVQANLASTLNAHCDRPIPAEPVNDDGKVWCSILDVAVQTYITDVCQAEDERRPARALLNRIRTADQQPAAHYPVEWGPSDARQLTCACGNPDPAHADQQSSALTQGEQDTFWNALLHQGPPDKPSA